MKKTIFVEFRKIKVSSDSSLSPKKDKMSVCQDRDFLLYRLRLVLFHTKEHQAQKFVSLPLTDTYDYIATSLSQGLPVTPSAHSRVPQRSNSIGARQESLKDPFHPNGTPGSFSDAQIRKAGSPLVSRPTIRPTGKRFAGTFGAIIKHPVEIAPNASIAAGSVQDKEQLEYVPTNREPKRSASIDVVLSAQRKSSLSGTENSSSIRSTPSEQHPNSLLPKAISTPTDLESFQSIESTTSPGSRSTQHGTPYAQHLKPRDLSIPRRTKFRSVSDPSRPLTPYTTQGANENESIPEAEDEETADLESLDNAEASQILESYFGNSGYAYVNAPSVPG